jgi:diaminopropionate ammonia-lyase
MVQPRQESIHERLLANVSAVHGSSSSKRASDCGTAGPDLAWKTISGWSEYAATPLLDLQPIARDLGIQRLWFKDESQRLGLGSFKALGGAYAVHQLLSEAQERITFAAATAGNHGRAVAWAAQRFGARSVIYVPATAAKERVKKLREHGAEVVLVAGGYDIAVRRLAGDAQARGWVVVSDTAYPGYVDIPRRIVHGYSVLIRETLAQLPQSEHLTHVFVQCGVGGLASAVAGYLRRALTVHPLIVVVEPESAACFFESVRHGKMRDSTSEVKTALGCLACTRLSLLAWPILRDTADFAMTIADEAAFDAMRKLAALPQPVAIGESGAAGLGGLLTARADVSISGALGLTSQSRVLVIGSEGPLDTRLYEQVTGARS